MPMTADCWEMGPPLARGGPRFRSDYCSESQVAWIESATSCADLPPT